MYRPGGRQACARRGHGGRQARGVCIAYTVRTIQLTVKETARRLLWTMAALAAGVAGAYAQRSEIDSSPGAGQTPELASAVAESHGYLSTASYTPPSGEERLRLYLRRAFWSPGLPFRVAAPAVASHLADRPQEWGQGSAGFGRRLADRYARVVLKESYEAAGAAALGHDVRYHPSGRSGAWGRAGYALAATVVTRDRHGASVPHVARLGAAFAAEFTGNAWMPAGYRSRTESVRSVAIGLSFTGLANLAREFAPEIKRLLPGR